MSGAIFLCYTCAKPYIGKVENLSVGLIEGKCERCRVPLRMMGSAAIQYWALRRTDVERIDAQRKERP